MVADATGGGEDQKEDECLAHKGGNFKVSPRATNDASVLRNIFLACTFLSSRGQDAEL